MRIFIGSLQSALRTCGGAEAGTSLLPVLPKVGNQAVRINNQVKLQNPSFRQPVQDFITPFFVSLFLNSLLSCSSAATVMSRKKLIHPKRSCQMDQSCHVKTLNMGFFHMGDLSVNAKSHRLTHIFEASNLAGVKRVLVIQCAFRIPAS